MEVKEKKTDSHVHASGKNDFFSSIRDNPWTITSIVLAVLLILLVVFGQSVFAGSQAGIVSKDKAASNVISFINSQGAEKATLVSAEKDGTLYKVTLNYAGDQIPVYTTLDGKSLIVNPISLSSEPSSDSSSSGSSTQNIPKSDKPKVELFVMSYCPYGTQIEKGIIPVVNLLKDKIDFKLKFVDYAMHPTQGEVQENTLQYCLQKDQPDKLIPYLTCFLKEGKSEACLNESKVDKVKLASCVSSADKQFNITRNLNDQASWAGGRYPSYLVDASDNAKYDVQGSPTLVINGQQASSGRDSASLLSTICAAFTNAPAECKQTLSNASPSAGFGYSTSTTGSANAADCGV